MRDLPQATFYDRMARGDALPEPCTIRAARRLRQGLRARTGADRLIRDCQRRWMGDLSGLRVLEIGCFTGNALTPVLVTQSLHYRGIDLSAEAVARLSDRLTAAGYTHAEVVQADVLSDDLGGPWDVVYAHGVLHHFRDMGTVLDRLADCMSPGARLITFDPLQTSPPIRLARAALRAFQKDAAWEFPLDRIAFRALEERFEIAAVQGILGRAKWAALLFPIPGMGGIASRALWHWYALDCAEATRPGRALWRCMSAALCCIRR